MSLENLEREVGEIETVIDSAVAAFQGIAQELRDAIASGNPQKQQELADRLDAKAQALAAATVRGTPAEGESSEGQSGESQRRR